MISMLNNRFYWTFMGLIKVLIGNSNNLRSRVLQHKDTYTNFRLMNAFKVENKLQIENAIKEHPLFIEHQRNTMIKGKKYVELISFDGLTYTQLDKTIKEIITTTECNPLKVILPPI